MVGITWLRKPQDNRASNQAAVLFLDLSLPLDRFIKCVVKGDLQALIISGNPTELQITQAWSNIYYAYIDLNNDNEIKYVIQLQKKISLLRNHVIEVEGCLLFLAEGYHKDLVRILRENGYKYDIDPDNTKPALEIIRNEFSLKKMSLESSQKEYDDYIEAHKNDDVSETFFIKMLIRLAKYQGVAIIKTRDISVYEFVMLMRDYMEWIDIHNREIEDIKNK